MDNIETKEFLDLFPNHLIWQGYDPFWNTTGKLVYKNMKAVNEKLINQGYGTFFTPNGFNKERDTKNISNLNAIFGDFDAHGSTPEETEALVQGKIIEIQNKLPPTYIIRTKNGIHTYWVLDESIDKESITEEEWNKQIDLYKSIMRSTVVTLGFDKASSDIPHVLRVPNYPHQKDLNDPYMVHVIYKNLANTYSLEQIKDIFPPITEEKEIQTLSEKAEANEFFDRVEELYPRITRPSTIAILSALPKTLPKDYARHTAMMIAAIILRDAGIPEEEAQTRLKTWHGLEKDRPKEFKAVVHDVYHKRLNYYATDGNEFIKYNITKEEQKKLKEIYKNIRAEKLPIPENVEETNTEEISISREFVKNKTSATFHLAKYLTKKYSIITVGESEREMFVYQNGIYRRAENELIYPEIQRILGDQINKSAKLETFHKIADMTSYPRSVFETAPYNFIPLKNGVYDMETKQLLPQSPEYRFTYQFPVIYNTEAKCPKTLAFLEQVLTDEQIPIIQEWLGYYFYRIYCFKKAVIFVGSGDTGKTTLLEMIIHLLGKENISSVSLQKMAGDKFAGAHMYEKHGNLVDELSAKDISDTGNFKVATGGGSISGEYKFGNQFSFLNFSKLTFACNKIPDIKDFDDEAYFNRWMIIRFEKIIEKKIPNFIKTLTTEEERSGLFNYAMEGLERLLQQEKFSYIKSAIETKLEMMRSGSSIAIFSAEKISQEVGAEISKEEMYDEYTKFCTENELSADTIKMFGSKFLFYVSYASEGLVYEGLKRVKGWRNVKVIKNEQEQQQETKLINDYDQM